MIVKSFADLKQELEARTDDAESAAGVFSKRAPWRSPAGQEMPGWYFWDEAYDLHGPFMSRSEARRARAVYCHTVLGDRQTMTKQRFFIRVLGTDKWVVARTVGPYLAQRGYVPVSAERLLEVEELWAQEGDAEDEARASAPAQDAGAGK